MKKILLIALLILCGCDRYELKEEGSGRLVRLDKLTGAMAVLEDDKLAEVKTAEDIEAATQAFVKAKVWPVITSLDNYGIEQIRFTTSWREGQLHYRARLEPYIEELWGRVQNRIIFKLRDEGTFLLLEISTSPNSYTRIVDGAGEVIYLNFEGKVPCSESTYRSIESIDLGWLLPDSLLNKNTTEE